MKRFVYAFDSVDAAKSAVSDLRKHGLSQEQFSIAARPDLEMEKIPEDLIDSSTDFGPAVARGIGLGGTAGLFAGLVMMAIPPLGIAVGGAGLLAFLTGGALVGAWTGGIVGSSIPDETRRKFDDEIEAGRILVIVDCDADHEQKLIQTMADRADQHLVWQSS